MTPSFLIFDYTGEGGKRSTRLKNLLKDRSFAVSVGTPSESSAETIFLSHRTDLDDRIAALLTSVGAAGRLVVVYTDGPMTSQDKDAVCFRSLTEVEKWLGWASSRWTVDEFRKSIDLDFANTRACGFAAIAILAQCVIAEVDDNPGARKRRSDWRTSNDHWKHILDSIPIDALLGIATFEGRRHVCGLLNWIKEGGEAPDFAKAASEASTLA